jgi:hypothetical protein
MESLFAQAYAKAGHLSIPPEYLLRALLLQALSLIRSERQLMEQLDCNLLFRWLVGLGMDGKVWSRTVFCINGGAPAGYGNGLAFLPPGVATGQIGGGPGDGRLQSQAPRQLARALQRFGHFPAVWGKIGKKTGKVKIQPCTHAT